MEIMAWAACTLLFIRILHCSLSLNALNFFPYKHEMILKSCLCAKGIFFDRKPKEYIQMHACFLLLHKSTKNWKIAMHIVLTGQNLI